MMCHEPTSPARQYQDRLSRRRRASRSTIRTIIAATSKTAARTSGALGSPVASRKIPATGPRVAFPADVGLRTDSPWQLVHYGHCRGPPVQPIALSLQPASVKPRSWASNGSGVLRNWSDYSHKERPRERGSAGVLAEGWARDRVPSAERGPEVGITHQWPSYDCGSTILQAPCSPFRPCRVRAPTRSALQIFDGLPHCVGRADQAAMAARPAAAPPSMEKLKPPPKV